MDLTEDQQGILDVLRLRAVGEKNAMLARRIATRAGIDCGRDRTCRQVTRAIEDLVLKDLAVVLSGPKGFWLPETPEEAEANAGRMERERVIPAMARVNAIRRGAQSMRRRMADTMPLLAGL